MREHELRNNHAQVLMSLADHGAMRQQALIQAIGVDPSVLVATLNDLENHGYAVRRRDPEDRRRHIVEISPTGMRLVADVNASFRAVEGELFAVLTPNEIDVLHQLLIRIGAGIGTAGCDSEDEAL
jgi:DNA-binding MarR family transcriptional regulator